jgi:adenylate cyclase
MHDPANIERKLAAIFSADVAGYSRLMAEDEVATLQGLTAERELMTELVRRHHDSTRVL